MIGIGKWKFSIDIFLFKGDVLVDISEKDGNYLFKPEVPDYKNEISYEVLEAKERGNTLHVVAATSMLPGKKTITADLTFNGDICSAVLELPYFGKLELNDGIRVG